LANLLRKLLKNNKNPQVEQIINAIYTASNISTCLIQDLLDFQLIEHGKFKMRYEKFDLHSVIVNLFKVLAPHARIRDNYFVLNAKMSFPKEVISDKNRITQVLLNLLMNANKFTTHGEIQVSCDLNTTKDKIIIRVRDEGIGIRD
jgi:signal transduction histidine kinase